MHDRGALEDYFSKLQARLVAAVEALEGPDGGRFRHDAWQRPDGGAMQGDGLTCVIEGGRLFERGGIARSRVRGAALPPSATARTADSRWPGAWRCCTTAARSSCNWAKARAC